ncbi:MAG: hypothetical protein HOO96_13100 [Polyangiaceae bacterium]|nr:hypothetical protein [Polyangiaceae bacterium]
MIMPPLDMHPGAVHISPRFHAPAEDGSALTFQVPTSLGPNFPLVPRIDREGQAFSSFQLMLQNSILSLRTALVTHSYAFESVDWFQNLRSYVSECVSLIDVTLHQLYFRAEYAPSPDWVFDPEKLGARHGRRLNDKMKWIYQITGQPFHAEEEMKAFQVIRELRNHLQHFDPPCLSFTLEHDVVQWLNAMPLIAQLSWKIRQAIGSPLSGPLIRMLLAPAVEFAAEDPRRPRVAPAAGIGYASTRWHPKN